MAGGVLVVVAWLAGRPAQWLRPSHVDEHGGRQRLGAWEKTGRTPGARQPHPVEPVSWEPGDVADVARPERWDGLAVAAGGAVAGPEQDDGAVHRVEHPPAGLVQ